MEVFALPAKFFLFSCLAALRALLWIPTAQNYLREPLPEHLSVNAGNIVGLQTAAQFRYFFRCPGWAIVCVRMLLHRPPTTRLQQNQSATEPSLIVAVLS